MTDPSESRTVAAQVAEGIADALKQQQDAITRPPGPGHAPKGPPPPPGNAIYGNFAGDASPPESGYEAAQRQRALLPDGSMTSLNSPAARERSSRRGASRASRNLSTSSKSYAARSTAGRPSLRYMAGRSPP